MDNLKPCPFCGDTMIKCTRTHIEIQIFEEDRYQIGCNTVGCFGYRPYSRKFETEKEAIKAWNMRH